MDIAHYGLTYVYYKYLNQSDDEDHKWEKTKHPRKVIIIGAGMAGLVAAYELAQVGHTVQVLEMQQRVGGRVKTFGTKEGFAEGLYVDGESYEKYGVIFILWM